MAGAFPDSGRADGLAEPAGREKGGKKGMAAQSHDERKEDRV